MYAHRSTHLTNNTLNEDLLGTDDWSRESIYSLIDDGRADAMMAEVLSWMDDKGMRHHGSSRVAASLIISRSDMPETRVMIEEIAAEMLVAMLIARGERISKSIVLRAITRVWEWLELIDRDKKVATDMALRGVMEARMAYVTIVSIANAALRSQDVMTMREELKREFAPRSKRVRESLESDGALGGADRGPQRMMAISDGLSVPGAISMSDALSRLDELFNEVRPWSMTSGDRLVQYSFDVPAADGIEASTIIVRFRVGNHDEYELEFFRRMASSTKLMMDVGIYGDTPAARRVSFMVLGTVVAIVRDFLTTVRPSSLSFFSASGAHTALYKAMVDRFGPELGELGYESVNTATTLFRIRRVKDDAKSDAKSDRKGLLGRIGDMIGLWESRGDAAARVSALVDALSHHVDGAMVTDTSTSWSGGRHASEVLSGTIDGVSVRVYVQVDPGSDRLWVMAHCGSMTAVSHVSRFSNGVIKPRDDLVTVSERLIATMRRFIHSAAEVDDLVSMLSRAGLTRMKGGPAHERDWDVAAAENGVVGFRVGDVDGSNIGCVIMTCAPTGWMCIRSPHFESDLPHPDELDFPSVAGSRIHHIEDASDVVSFFSGAINESRGGPGDVAAWAASLADLFMREGGKTSREPGFVGGLEVFDTMIDDHRVFLTIMQSRSPSAGPSNVKRAWPLGVGDDVRSVRVTCTVIIDGREFEAVGGDSPFTIDNIEIPIARSVLDAHEYLVACVRRAIGFRDEAAAMVTAIGDVCSAARVGCRVVARTQTRDRDLELFIGGIDDMRGAGAGVAGLLTGLLYPRRAPSGWRYVPRLGVGGSQLEDRRAIILEDDEAALALVSSMASDVAAATMNESRVERGDAAARTSSLVDMLSREIDDAVVRSKRVVPRTWNPLPGQSSLVGLESEWVTGRVDGEDVTVYVRAEMNGSLTVRAEGGGMLAVSHQGGGCGLIGPSVDLVTASEMVMASIRRFIGHSDEVIDLVSRFEAVGLSALDSSWEASARGHGIVGFRVSDGDSVIGCVMMTCAPLGWTCISHGFLLPHPDELDFPSIAKDRIHQIGGADEVVSLFSRTSIEESRGGPGDVDAYCAALIDMFIRENGGRSMPGNIRGRVESAWAGVGDSGVHIDVMPNPQAPRSIVVKCTVSEKDASFATGKEMTAIDMDVFSITRPVSDVHEYIMTCAMRFINMQDELEALAEDVQRVGAAVGVEVKCFVPPVFDHHIVLSIGAIIDGAPGGWLKGSIAPARAPVGFVYYPWKGIGGRALSRDKQAAVRLEDADTVVEMVREIALGVLSGSLKESRSAPGDAAALADRVVDLFVSEMGVVDAPRRIRLFLQDGGVWTAIASGQRARSRQHTISSFTAEAYMIVGDRFKAYVGLGPDGDVLIDVYRRMNAMDVPAMITSHAASEYHVTIVERMIASLRRFETMSTEMEEVASSLRSTFEDRVVTSLSLVDDGRFKITTSTMAIDMAMTLTASDYKRSIQRGRKEPPISEDLHVGVVLVGDVYGTLSTLTMMPGPSGWRVDFDRGADGARDEYVCAGLFDTPDDAAREAASSLRVSSRLGGVISEGMGAGDPSAMAARIIDLFTRESGLVRVKPGVSQEWAERTGCEAISGYLDGKPLPPWLNGRVFASVTPVAGGVMVDLLLTNGDCSIGVPVMMTTHAASEDHVTIVERMVSSLRRFALIRLEGDGVRDSIRRALGSSFDPGSHLNEDDQPGRFACSISLMPVNDIVAMTASDFLARMNPRKGGPRRNSRIITLYAQCINVEISNQHEREARFRIAGRAWVAFQPLLATLTMMPGPSGWRVDILGDDARTYKCIGESLDQDEAVEDTIRYVTGIEVVTESRTGRGDAAAWAASLVDTFIREEGGERRHQRAGDKGAGIERAHFKIDGGDVSIVAMPAKIGVNRVNVYCRLTTRFGNSMVAVNGDVDSPSAMDMFDEFATFSIDKLVHDAHEYIMLSIRRAKDGLSLITSMDEEVKKVCAEEGVIFDSSCDDWSGIRLSISHHGSRTVDADIQLTMRKAPMGWMCDIYMVDGIHKSDRAESRKYLEDDSDVIEFVRRLARRVAERRGVKESRIGRGDAAAWAASLADMLIREIGGRSNPYAYDSIMPGAERLIGSIDGHTVRISLVPGDFSDHGVPSMQAYADVQAPNSGVTIPAIEGGTDDHGMFPITMAAVDAFDIIMRCIRRVLNYRSELSEMCRSISEACRALGVDVNCEQSESQIYVTLSGDRHGYAGYSGILSPTRSPGGWSISSVWNRSHTSSASDHVYFNDAQDALDFVNELAIDVGSKRIDESRVERGDAAAMIAGIVDMFITGTGAKSVFKGSLNPDTADEFVACSINGANTRLRVSVDEAASGSPESSISVTGTVKIKLEEYGSIIFYHQVHRVTEDRNRIVETLILSHERFMKAHAELFHVMKGLAEVMPSEHGPYRVFDKQRPSLLTANHEHIAYSDIMLVDYALKMIKNPEWKAHVPETWTPWTKENAVLCIMIRLVRPGTNMGIKAAVITMLPGMKGWRLDVRSSMPNGEFIEAVDSTSIEEIVSEVGSRMPNLIEGLKQLNESRSRGNVAVLSDNIADEEDLLESSSARGDSRPFIDNVLDGCARELGSSHIMDERYHDIHRIHLSGGMDLLIESVDNGSSVVFVCCISRSNSSGDDTFGSLVHSESYSVGTDPARVVTVIISMVDRAMSISQEVKEIVDDLASGLRTAGSSVSITGPGLTPYGTGDQFVWCRNTNGRDVPIVWAHNPSNHKKHRGYFINELIREITNPEIAISDSDSDELCSLIMTPGGWAIKPKSYQWGTSVGTFAPDEIAREVLSRLPDKTIKDLGMNVLEESRIGRGDAAAAAASIVDSFIQESGMSSSKLLSVPRGDVLSRQSEYAQGFINGRKCVVDVSHSTSPEDSLKIVVGVEVASLLPYKSTGKVLAFAERFQLGSDQARVVDSMVFACRRALNCDKEIFETIMMPLSGALGMTTHDGNKFSSPEYTLYYSVFEAESMRNACAQGWADEFTRLNESGHKFIDVVLSTDKRPKNAGATVYAHVIVLQKTNSSWQAGVKATITMLPGASGWRLDMRDGDRLVFICRHENAGDVVSELLERFKPNGELITESVGHGDMYARAQWLVDEFIIRHSAKMIEPSQNYDTHQCATFTSGDNVVFLEIRPMKKFGLDIAITIVPISSIQYKTSAINALNEVYTASENDRDMILDVIDASIRRFSDRSDIESIIDMLSGWVIKNGMECTVDRSQLTTYYDMIWICSANGMTPAGYKTAGWQTRSLFTVGSPHIVMGSPDHGIIGVIVKLPGLRGWLVMINGNERTFSDVDDVVDAMLIAAERRLLRGTVDESRIAPGDATAIAARIAELFAAELVDSNRADDISYNDGMVAQLVQGKFDGCFVFCECSTRINSNTDISFDTIRISVSISHSEQLTYVAFFELVSLRNERDVIRIVEKMIASVRRFTPRYMNEELGMLQHGIIDILMKAGFNKDDVSGSVFNRPNDYGIFSPFAPRHQRASHEACVIAKHPEHDYRVVTAYMEPGVSSWHVETKQMTEDGTGPKVIEYRGVDSWQSVLELVRSRFDALFDQPSFYDEDDDDELFESSMRGESVAFMAATMDLLKSKITVKSSYEDDGSIGLERVSGITDDGHNVMFVSATEPGSSGFTKDSGVIFAAIVDRNQPQGENDRWLAFYEEFMSINMKPYDVVEKIMSAVHRFSKKDDVINDVTKEISDKLAGSNLKVVNNIVTTSRTPLPPSHSVTYLPLPHYGARSYRQKQIYHIIKSSIVPTVYVLTSDENGGSQKQKACMAMLPWFEWAVSDTGHGFKRYDTIEEAISEVVNISKALNEVREPGRAAALTAASIDAIAALWIHDELTKSIDTPKHHLSPWSTSPGAARSELIIRLVRGYNVHIEIVSRDIGLVVNIVCKKPGGDFIEMRKSFEAASTRSSTIVDWCSEAIMTCANMDDVVTELTTIATDAGASVNVHSQSLHAMIDVDIVHASTAVENVTLMIQVQLMDHGMWNIKIFYDSSTNFQSSEIYTPDITHEFRSLIDGLKSGDMPTWGKITESKSPGDVVILMDNVINLMSNSMAASIKVDEVDDDVYRRVRMDIGDGDFLITLELPTWHFDGRSMVTGGAMLVYVAKTECAPFVDRCIHRMFKFGSAIDVVSWIESMIDAIKNSEKTLARIMESTIIRFSNFDPSQKLYFADGLGASRYNTIDKSTWALGIRIWTGGDGFCVVINLEKDLTWTIHWSFEKTGNSWVANAVERLASFKKQFGIAFNEIHEVYSDILDQVIQKIIDKKNGVIDLSESRNPGDAAAIIDQAFDMFVDVHKHAEAGSHVNDLGGKVYELLIEPNIKVSMYDVAYSSDKMRSTRGVCIDIERLPTSKQYSSTMISTVIYGSELTAMNIVQRLSSVLAMIGNISDVVKELKEKLGSSFIVTESERYWSINVKRSSHIDDHLLNGDAIIDLRADGSWLISFTFLDEAGQYDRKRSSSVRCDTDEILNVMFEKFAKISMLNEMRSPGDKIAIFTQLVDMLKQNMIEGLSFDKIENEDDEFRHIIILKSRPNTELILHRQLNTLSIAIIFHFVQSKREGAPDCAIDITPIIVDGKNKYNDVGRILETVPSDLQGFYSDKGSSMPLRSDMMYQWISWKLELIKIVYDSQVRIARFIENSTKNLRFPARYKSTDVWLDFNTYEFGRIVYALEKEDKFGQSRRTLLYIDNLDKNGKWSIDTADISKNSISDDDAINKIDEILLGYDQKLNEQPIHAIANKLNETIGGALNTIKVGETAVTSIDDDAGWRYTLIESSGEGLLSITDKRNGKVIENKDCDIDHSIGWFEDAKKAMTIADETLEDQIAKLRETFVGFDVQIANSTSYRVTSRSANMNLISNFECSEDGFMWSTTSNLNRKKARSKDLFDSVSMAIDQAHSLNESWDRGDAAAIMDQVVDSFRNDGAKIVHESSEEKSVIMTMHSAFVSMHVIGKVIHVSIDRLDRLKFTRGDWFNVRFGDAYSVSMKIMSAIERLNGAEHALNRLEKKLKDHGIERQKSGPEDFDERTEAVFIRPGSTFICVVSVAFGPLKWEDEHEWVMKQKYVSRSLSWDDSAAFEDDDDIVKSICYDSLLSLGMIQESKSPGDVHAVLEQTRDILKKEGWHSVKPDSNESLLIAGINKDAGALSIKRQPGDAAVMENKKTRVIICPVESDSTIITIVTHEISDRKLMDAKNHKFLSSNDIYIWIESCNSRLSTCLIRTKNLCERLNKEFKDQGLTHALAEQSAVESHVIHVNWKNNDFDIQRRLRITMTTGIPYWELSNEWSMVDDSLKYTFSPDDDDLVRNAVMAIKGKSDVNVLTESEDFHIAPEQSIASYRFLMERLAELMGATSIKTSEKIITITGSIDGSNVWLICSNDRLQMLSEINDTRRVVYDKKINGISSDQIIRGVARAARRSSVSRNTISRVIISITERTKELHNNVNIRVQNGSVLVSSIDGTIMRNMMRVDQGSLDEYIVEDLIDGKVFNASLEGVVKKFEECLDLMQQPGEIIFGGKLTKALKNLGYSQVADGFLKDGVKVTVSRIGSGRAVFASDRRGRTKYATTSVEDVDILCETIMGCVQSLIDHDADLDRIVRVVNGTFGGLISASRNGHRVDVMRGHDLITIGHASSGFFINERDNTQSREDVKGVIRWLIETFEKNPGDVTVFVERFKEIISHELSGTIDGPLVTWNDRTTLKPMFIKTDLRRLHYHGEFVVQLHHHEIIFKKVLNVRSAADAIECADIVLRLIDFYMDWMNDGWKRFIKLVQDRVLLLAPDTYGINGVLIGSFLIVKDHGQRPYNVASVIPLTNFTYNVSDNANGRLDGSYVELHYELRATSEIGFSYEDAVDLVSDIILKRLKKK